jgi:alpha-ketoglutarate-dependent taurine dioxygenase
MSMVIRVADQKHNLPLVIEPQGRSERELDDLISWYGDNRDFLERALLKHGAILFRGFAVKAPAAYAKFVRSISCNLLDYIDGNSPRTKLADGIYTSTEYPSEFSISLHNELSYSSSYPSRLIFCCIVAPQEGGETPIADSRAILRSLPFEIVEAFTNKRVKYIRNMHGGHGYGLSWQDTFETTDKETVEKFCERASINYKWKPDGGLELTQIGPGVITHPQTGEQVWFNQADQFHPSNNPKSVWESMRVIYRGADDALPQNACFGDGTLIGVSMLDRIRAVAREQSVCFPWREGDVLMIDNLLVCHGRMPYSGPRRILLSMF